MLHLQTALWGIKWKRESQHNLYRLKGGGGLKLSNDFNYERQRAEQKDTA
jgi:hypothetical protein